MHIITINAIISLETILTCYNYICNAVSNACGTKTWPSHQHRFVHNHPDTNPTSPATITRVWLLANRAKFHTMGINSTRMYMHAHHKACNIQISLWSHQRHKQIKNQNMISSLIMHTPNNIKHAFYSINPNTIDYHGYNTAYTLNAHKVQTVYLKSDAFQNKLEW